MAVLSDWISAFAVMVGRGSTSALWSSTLFTFVSHERSGLDDEGFRAPSRSSSSATTTTEVGECRPAQYCPSCCFVSSCSTILLSVFVVVVVVEFVVLLVVCCRRLCVLCCSFCSAAALWVFLLKSSSPLLLLLLLLFPFFVDKTRRNGTL